MRISTVLIATSALALAACGETAVSVDDTSDADQMADAAANLPNPEPGEYSTTGELVELTAPGAPEEELAMARQFMGAVFAQENRNCITQEEADEGYERFVQEMGANDDECEVSSYETTSDSFTAVMACGGDAANAGTMTFEGDVSGTSMDMTMTIEGQDPSMGGDMRMVIRMASERVGDCPAEGAAEG